MKDLKLTATLNDQVSKGIDALGTKIQGLTARLKGEGDKQAAQGRQAADRLLADLDKRERDRIRMQRASIALEERIEKERGAIQTRASVNSLRETKSRADATLRIERQASLAQASMVVDRFDRRIAIERARHGQILADLKGNDRAQEAELRRHASVVNRIQMDKANLPNTPFQRLLGHLGQGPSLATAMGPQVAAGTGAALRGVGVELMAMAGPLAAGALGFAALTKGMRMAYAAAEESHQAEVSLRAVMQATGNTAGGNFEKLSELANGYQKLTNFQDEAVMSAQGVLLQFGQIGKETFPRALAAAIDLASLMGTDLKSAATDLGQALQDPETAARKLRTMNILLTQSQRDQLKTWMEGGEQAKAQAFILGQLESKAKGHAESTALATTRLGNAFGEAAESIGTVFFNAAQMGAQALLELAGAGDKAAIAAAKLNKEAFDKKAMDGGFANYGENVVKATGATLAFQKALEESHRNRNPEPPPPPKPLTEAQIKAAEEAKKQAKSVAISDRAFREEKEKADEDLRRRIVKASRKEQAELVAEDEARTAKIYENRARVAEKAAVAKSQLDQSSIAFQQARSAGDPLALQKIQQDEELKALGDNEAAKTELKRAHELERQRLTQQTAQMGVAGIASNLRTVAQQYKSFSGVYKAMAHSQNMIDTYASATASYKALAGIPIVGPGLGAAAAAAAVGAGLANASAINSQKFAQGTFQAPGGRALVGENGPEYVDLPAGSKVRTARETQEMRQGGNRVHFNPVVTIQMSPGVTRGEAAMVADSIESRLKSLARDMKEIEYRGIRA